MGPRLAKSVQAGELTLVTGSDNVMARERVIAGNVAVHRGDGDGGGGGGGGDGIEVN